MTMKEPKVEVKNVKFHQGRDFDGVNADVFINGVKVYHVLDDGNGGCLMIDLLAYSSKNPDIVKALAKELNDYIGSIPETPMDFGNGVEKDKDGNILMHKPNLNDYINDLISDVEKNKSKKKMEKQMESAILYGVPNGYSYSMVKYKISLADLVKTHKAKLQQKVTEIQVNECKKGVKILNTNLEALGIQI